MKLETMLKRKMRLEAEIADWHYHYDNLRINAGTRSVVEKMQWRLTKLRHDIAEQLKDTDEYKQYMQLKHKYAEYNLS